MRVIGGVVAMLVLAALGSLLWVEAVPQLWQRTFARPCPADAPASNCMVRLPGVAWDRFDDWGEGSAWIKLTIPDGAPTDTGVDLYYTGVLLSISDANRLGITGERQQVEVTLFDNDVVALTGPNGQAAESEVKWLALGAFIGLVFVTGAVILTVVAGGLLWRLLPGRRASWMPRAATITTVGAITGVTAGVASGTFGAAWLMPTTFIVTALVSLIAAVVPLTRVRVVARR